MLSGAMRFVAASLSSGVVALIPCLQRHKASCAYLVVTGDIANGIVIGYQTLEYSLDPIYVPRHDHHSVSMLIPTLTPTALPSVDLVLLAVGVEVGEAVDRDMGGGGWYDHFS